LGFESYHPEELLASHNKKTNFDVVIDCSGNPIAIEQSINWLNPLGKFMFFGICSKDTMIRINPFKIFQKELSLFGSVINPFTFSRALELIQQIRRPIENLGVKFHSLQQYQQAIKAAREGNVTKILFKF
jgi:threonine dehydrogenase-like Zn-dependent dehydrogenase